MDDEQIKHMVNRFLSWTLPESFAPDNGISYSQRAYAPTGTNLFTYTQARAMVAHMLIGLPEGDPEYEGPLTEDDEAMIEAAWEMGGSRACGKTAGGTMKSCMGLTASCLAFVAAQGLVIGRLKATAHGCKPGLRKTVAWFR